MFSVVPAVVQVGYQFFIKPRLRGASQESRIDKQFRKFKGANYARVKDVMLQRGDRTSQIDNLLITRHGIFVIESKNYSGVIQGRERSPRWQQIHPSGRYKPREFYNPIWQNEGHIRALKQLIGQKYPKFPYYNLVVFSDECKCPRIPGVVKVSEMNKTIKGAFAGPPILSEAEVAGLKELLERSNITDRQSRTEHLEHVRYAAAMAKERERMEAVRQRAEAHRENATRVQNAYWTGRAARDGRNAIFETGSGEKPLLNEQIQTASQARANASNLVREKEVTPTVER